jgi:apolipoprotein N-acyltransferase
MTEPTAAEAPAARGATAPTSPLALRLAASVLSGVLLVFIAAPVNLHWAHWLSFVPMLWAMQGAPGDRRAHKVNALVAFAGGWVAIFWLYFWIIETIGRFSNLPWAVGFGLHSFFAFLFALPYPLVFPLAPVLRRHLGRWWLLAWPALEVAVEMLPALFPYYHGVSQYRFLPTYQLTSVTGITGLTFLVFLTNALGAEWLWSRREARPLPWLPTGLTAGALAGVVAFGLWRIEALRAAAAEAPAVRVAILQQNVTMEQRLKESPFAAVMEWEALSLSAKLLSPDLVIWPEGTSVLNPDDERRFKSLNSRSPMELFSTLATRLNADLLIGGGTMEDVPKSKEAPRGFLAYNSAYGFTRDGALNGRYDKMIPLPFGEYIPLSGTFPILNELISGPGDFRAGDTPTTFDGTTAEGHAYTYAVPICYEAILNLSMHKLRAGTRETPVDLFVVITNDAWFGDTSSPHQHAMLTTIHALQLGRPMVRMAYTGVSWVVDPDGQIRHETAPFTDVTDVATVPLVAVETVYVRGGWIFPYLCIGGAVGALFVARRRARATA